MTRGVGDPELAIARSVLYASLFDYPLTLAQLRSTLIESVQTPSQILATYAASQALQAMIEHRDGFFFPRGRYDFVSERRRREARSRVFLRRHRRLLAAIAAIPYVRMVALSGSIAHLNLNGKGDLDLFIVTRGRRAWSVTVAVILLAKLVRRRRLVCANYVVADSSLDLEQPDLFTASQIIQLKPVVGHEVFRHVLAANPFVVALYPNFHDMGPGPFGLRRPIGFDTAKRGLEALLLWPSAAVEVMCRVAYRWHLMRHTAAWRSPDQVCLRSDCLKLHTQSHRHAVLDRFERTVRDAVQEMERVAAGRHTVGMVKG